MRRTTWMLAALLLVSACATTSQRMTPAERFEWYRAHAGEPVRSIHAPVRLWGWRSLGDSALTVWTRSDTGFLVELVGRCPDMAFASSIGLTTRTGRVWAGFDSIVFQSNARPGGQVTCRIDTIRPLNTRVVKEAKSDLHEVDTLDRDTVTPETPQ